ncbi:P-loop containing nucleoside triphosphate hydrolase protein [Tothia fuscella]|uniref:Origin recognition complex subunit 1 n=1 Tax=Tothia fuscella TaxID=1048955 RepID=A0A9P4NSQ5_9PEZI|nr:P-loop containing nucleoside triphosphate hydrolase protein [Tothia fuscella]
MGAIQKPKQTKLERARDFLKGGGVSREDSDDELGTEDYPWEWMYEDDNHEDIKNGTKKRKSTAAADSTVIGARMGLFECRLGDAVLLKSEAGSEAWVGIVQHFFEDEETGDKMANFMWFSTPNEIRNKAKKRTDALEHELYISLNYDDNPLESINGKALILSPDAYAKKFPKGTVPRNSKLFGKVFICRRGCNTRTATYTEEFVWEDIYREFDNIYDLEDLIKAGTKETRKKQRAPKRSDLEEFVADDDEEGGPRTPKKRRKFNDAVTPTSKRKELTPRKFLTPSHKRIVVKKALEFTPLGTRILSPTALSSPFQVARNQLHVSSVPATLPCREEEFSEVYNHLEKAITDGTGSCIYIAGTPGTGKTATVREVIAQLNASVQAEELDDFIFVEINGMKVTDPHQSYSLLWEALREERVSPAHALDLLEREFSAPSPRRVPCVVLMDELDQLVTKNQSVMYNFFNWPGLRHSRLIVLAVANTMDLPERTLSNKISSRLGLYRITFKGYTHAQLIQIIESRLANAPGNIVHPDAIQFASRKVAAVSGDARRALDICRRAVEIAESESATQDTQGDAPGTPSKKGRGLKATGDTPLKKGLGKQHTVTIATIKQAINEATSSPLQQYLRALPLASKLFLAALLARVRRSGIGEVMVGDVLDEARTLGLLTELAPIHDVLLLEGKHDGDGDERRAATKTNGSGAAPRVIGMESAIMGLAEAGIVGVESRKGERARRVRLGVGDEEVRLALKDDEEVKGLGFGS